MEQRDAFPERSATIESDRVAETLQDLTIIDVDVHLSFYADEIQRDIADRLKNPYSKQLKYYLNEGSTYGFSYWASDTWDRDLMGKAPTTLAKVTEPEHIREVISSEFHVDYPIVDPLPDLNMIQQNDRAVAIMQATNDMLIDRFLDKDEDMYGLITMIPHDPEACAEEIDRLASEDQIVGAFWNSSGVRTPLGDPQYDVVYRAAEDAGIPLIYHAAANPGMEIDFPILQYELNTYFANHALTHLFSQMMNLTSVIENGVPEKFPDLTFVFKEVGIAWITTMFRLNREYKERKPEMPLVKKLPEEYIRDQFYISTQPLGEPIDSRHITQLMEIVGPEMMMFSTDYPHFDFDSTDYFMKLLTSFTDEEREQIFSKNAAEVYGIDV